MSILFINGSPNKNGNTVDIAKILLKDKKIRNFKFSNRFIKLK